MNEDEIKSEIERFRKMVVDEVEEYFRDYVVMDMLEAGEANYLIDDLSWYLHWLSITRDLTRFMNQIIGEHYEGKKEYRQYLDECVKFRQIVDKELMSNPHFNPEEVSVEMEGGIYEGHKKDEKQDFINVLGDQSKRESKLSTLHRELSSKGLIDITLEDFSIHFNSYNGDREKIKWFGTEVQITALFVNLVYKGVIDRSYEYRIPSTIPNHFNNKKEQEFKDRQLRVALSRVRSGDVDHLISDIVELVESLTEIN